jgi:hypothetical protein
MIGLRINVANLVLYRRMLFNLEEIQRPWLIIRIGFRIILAVHLGNIAQQLRVQPKQMKQERVCVYLVKLEPEVLLGRKLSAARRLQLVLDPSAALWEPMERWLQAIKSQLNVRIMHSVIISPIQRKVVFWRFRENGSRSGSMSSLPFLLPTKPELQNSIRWAHFDTQLWLIIRQL